MLIFKIILLLYSFIGYIYLLSNKLKIDIEYSIPLVIVINVCILYLFSLIHLLMIMSFVIYVFGILLSSYYLIKFKLNFIKYIFKFNFIICLLLIVLIAFSIQNLHLLHFDNFSHWAVISRQLLDLNDIPNASNILTSYFEYPLASSYLIYYFCFFTNKSEQFMLIAQMSLLILFSLPLLSFSKRKRLTDYLLFFVYIIFVLVIDNSVADLLVDSLLGVTAVMTCCFYCKYGENLKKILYLSIVLNLFLLILKNIAIFFVGLNILSLFYLIFKNRKVLNIKEKITDVIYIFIPVVLFSFWKIRCNLVFGNTLSAQSVSLTNYKSNFFEKTMGDIKNIFVIFIKNLYSFNNLGSILIFILIVFLIIYLVKRKMYKKLYICLIVLFVYMLYNFFLLFSYVFSMCLDEALRLASYDRYNFTVVIFLVGFVIIFICLVGKKDNAFKVIISILLLIFILNSNDNLKNLFGIQDYKSSIRYEIDHYFNEKENINLNNYLVISNAAMSDGYVTNVLNYNLKNRNYDFVKDTKLLNNYNVEDFDYIITLDNDTYVKLFMDDCNCYDGGKGIYKIK